MERRRLTLRESQLQLRELATYSSEANYWTLRSDQPTLVWTDIEGIDASLGNLFAPCGAIFWSLGKYRAYRRSEDAFAHSRYQLPETRAVIDRAIVSAGAEPKSLFSFRLLAGLTRMYGDRYAPDEPADAERDFALAQRHLPIIAPIESRQAVHAYFERQLADLGEAAIRGCDEDTTLVITGAFDADRHHLLLSKHVMTMTPSERQKVREQIDLIGVAVQSWRIGIDADLLYGCPGNFELSLTRSLTDARLREDFAEIARFRVKAALSLCTLLVLERIRGQLDSAGWTSLGELRDELCALLDARLEAYPVVTADPLAGVVDFARASF